MVQIDPRLTEDFFGNLQSRIQRLLVFLDQIYAAQLRHIEYANILKVFDEHYRKLNMFKIKYYIIIDIPFHNFDLLSSAYLD